MTKSPPKGIVGFLKEAKRRKVYLSFVAYAGVSLALIELTGAVAEALLFPDWTTRLVTFLLILGLPVVMVLAWTFDITGQGVVRTGHAGDDRDGAKAERSEGPVVRSTAPPSPAKRKSSAARSAIPAPRRRRPILGDGEALEAADPSELDPERVRRATLAHMRHELRTPINGIIGYSEMLLEDEEDEAFTGDLKRIRAGGGTLLNLIDQLLDPSGIADKDKDLEAYAEQIRMDLRTPVTSVLGYAEILLETAQETERDDLVADLERIHLAARNLLELSGDIVGIATLGEMTSGMDGSDATDLTRSVLSKIQPGTGEGVTEAEGRLLVVDDNEMNRDLLSRQLARQGYVVLTASDGVEALELLENQGVDLILLDVIMPRMDGVETLKRLKSSESLREIPVLMLSSLDEMEGALRCIEMGAEDYLSKPVRPAILDARINASLELHRMRERERAYEERAASDEAFIDQLLLGSFPEGVADRVRAGESDLSDVVAEATVLRCRIRGLGMPTSSNAVSERLRGLREIGLAIEGLAREHGVETCIWRADGFLAVAGSPTAEDDHMDRGLAMGRALLQEAGRLTGPDGQPLRIGLGLHTGPVVAAALGGERLRYEVWGEGVNTAEGVAEVAPDGTLLATPPVHARLKDRFSFHAQKVQDIGGVQMRTYLLEP